MGSVKQDRILQILFLGMQGEALSVRKLANEHGVSRKSITRDINDIKAFLADNRDVVGNTELQYSYKDRCYYLHRENLLTHKEFSSLVELVMDSKKFSGIEAQNVIEKLKGMSV